MLIASEIQQKNPLACLIPTLCDEHSCKNKDRYTNKSCWGGNFTRPSCNKRFQPAVSSFSLCQRILDKNRGFSLSTRTETPGFKHGHRGDTLASQESKVQRSVDGTSKHGD